MTEYLDKPPFVAPSEPTGPCDWLESCWLPSTDWRRDPETKGFVPVCAQHSLEAREQALLAERDAAEESRRFYMAERDRLLARVAELERVAEASAIAIQDRDDRIQELRVRGAELEGALRQIAGLDPEDSSEGRNEWGEAEMFEKAQEIAREELAREDI